MITAEEMIDDLINMGELDGDFEAGDIFLGSALLGMQQISEVCDTIKGRLASEGESAYRLRMMRALGQLARNMENYAHRIATCEENAFSGLLRSMSENCTEMARRWQVLCEALLGQDVIRGEEGDALVCMLKNCASSLFHLCCYLSRPDLYACFNH